ncbi:hypothetical protein TeGR_g11984 [Tetraparma gracilis]|uniref:Uncharacterized protein n=1 Tax=Tetraparma gracilis TaxID=2962635 RepID=A0ABQ6MML0_9STRA|nr:hypothetical protein TeGR_g11984 [Tetraparma gracilis]
MHEYGDTSLVNSIDAELKTDLTSYNAERGDLRGIWRLHSVAPNVCKVTLCMSVTPGGSMPQWIADHYIQSSTSGVAVQLLDKCERSFKLVDAELREAYPDPPVYSELNADQKIMADSCIRLDAGRWVEKKSPYKLIKIKTQRNLVGGDDRRVGLGMAECDVDCHPKEAAVWLFSYCSRERIHLSKQKSDVFRIIVEETSRHEQTIASVKKLPFPMRKREVVSHLLMFQDKPPEDGGPPDIVVCAEPVPTSKIDYGTRITAVRSFVRILARFSLVGTNRSKVNIVMNFDARGNIPASIMTLLVPRSLFSLNQMRTLFQRDDEVDAHTEEILAAKIKTSEETYTADENGIINGLYNRLGAGLNFDFVELASPDPLVKMEERFVEEQGVDNKKTSTVSVSCNTVLDTSVELAGAHELNRTSRKLLLRHQKKYGNTDYNFKWTSGHAFEFQCVVPTPLIMVSSREFVMHGLWKWMNEKTLVIVMTPLSNERDYPLQKGIVRAEASVIVELKQRPPVGDTPQCALSYSYTLDLAGSLSRSASSTAQIRHLSRIADMRKKFDKSEMFNEATRRPIVEKLKKSARDGPMELTAVQEEVVARGVSLLYAVDDHSNKKPNKDYKDDITCYTKGDSHGLSRSTITIRCKKEEALAYLIDASGRYPRDYVTQGVWTTQRDGSLLFVGVPSSHVDYPAMHPERRSFLESMRGGERRSGRERSARSGRAVSNRKGSQGPRRTSAARGGGSGIGSMSSTLVAAFKRRRRSSVAMEERTRTRMSLVAKITTKADQPGFCEVTWVHRLSLENRNGVGVLLRHHLTDTLAEVRAMEQYFLSVRKLEDYDFEDGASLGKVLSKKMKGERLQRKPGESGCDVRMNEIFYRYKGLRELDKEHPSVKKLMAAVLENKLRPPTELSVKLANMRDDDARKIGCTFAISLASHQTAQAAVDEWIIRFGALQQLDAEQPWFRPMMHQIAMKLLGDAAWGLKARLFFGAALSMVDMASDLNMVVLYWSNDQFRDAYLLLGCILGSILLQLFVVWIQNGAKPTHLLRDVFFVITGLKAGVDAVKVASGSEMEEHHLFSAHMELIANKCIELIFEAIPGCILQIYAYLRMKQLGDAASLVLLRRSEFSIIMSALTTGFTSSMISYDFDVDPQRRKETPDYYGYIPDEAMKRSIIFMIMLLNSAVLLLLRSLSAALVLIIDGRYLGAYMLADMGMYYIQKLVRRDFWYWLPTKGLGMSVLIAFLMRTMIKLLTDYTGIIQFRHPGELGGLYWTLNLVFAGASSIVFAVVYVKSTSGGGVEDRIPVDWLTFVVASLVASWFVTFGVFLALMKKEHIYSFFSPENVHDHYKSMFLYGADDEHKEAIGVAVEDLGRDRRTDVQKANDARAQSDKSTNRTDTEVSAGERDGEAEGGGEGGGEARRAAAVMPVN